MSCSYTYCISHQFKNRLQRKHEYIINSFSGMYLTDDHATKYLIIEKRWGPDLILLSLLEHGTVPGFSEGGSVAEQSYLKYSCRDKSS